MFFFFLRHLARVNLMTITLLTNCYKKLIMTPVRDWCYIQNLLLFCYLNFSGSVPVVVGAPNIQDFAPSNGSILHIKELSDVEWVAKKMKYLAKNPEAYNQSLRYILFLKGRFFWLYLQMDSRFSRTKPFLVSFSDIF